MDLPSFQNLGRKRAVRIIPLSYLYKTIYCYFSTLRKVLSRSFDRKMLQFSVAAQPPFRPFCNSDKYFVFCIDLFQIYSKL
jgi:hypothetical protein